MRGDPPRPLRNLGLAVIGLLGLVILANLLALWADVIQLGLVTDIRDGKRVGLEELTESDDRVATTGLLQVGAYVACVVAFLIWYGRAFRNLERLGARGLHWGKRAVIVYWFIPIVNLFLPKQVVNDIWRASDPDLPAVTGNWDQLRVPALLHWWLGALADLERRVQCLLPALAGRGRDPVGAGLDRDGIRRDRRHRHRPRDPRDPGRPRDHEQAGSPAHAPRAGRAD